MNAAELTARRAMLVARAEAQRDALSFYMHRLQAPVRLVEKSCRLARLITSPLLVASLSWFLARKKKRKPPPPKQKASWLWLAQQSWQLFTAWKRLRR